MNGLKREIVAAPQMWNHTPTAFRVSASLDSFKCHLKAHYFDLPLITCVRCHVRATASETEALALPVREFGTVCHVACEHLTSAIQTFSNTTEDIYV